MQSRALQKLKLRNTPHKNISKPLALLSLALLCNVSLVAAKPQENCDFLWGTASAAYQVEGGWNLDGKGPSNWDDFTHRGITKYIIGEAHTGDIATNQISRETYLKDIKLMRSLGVNSYRFSISWARVMPDGHTINSKGLEYYGTLIKDLKNAGIIPIVTLYHWDMPLALYKKGGWYSPESPDWFASYAKLIFRNFAQEVPYFITFNEPEGNIFTLTPLAENLLTQTPSPYEKVLSVESRAAQAGAMHNLLLANSLAVTSYKDAGYKGRIGIALNLSPCIDNVNPESAAKKSCNSVHNAWVLDALYKGSYPKEIRLLYQKYAPGFQPTQDEMKKIMRGRPDFIGVNFYSPTLVKDDPTQPFGIGNRPNPDQYPSYNGPVSPSHLVELLKQIDKEYAHPSLIITENGAGFGVDDEKLKDNMILDPLRAKYLSDHIDAALSARNTGVKVEGYLFWSLPDNFEWLFGYRNRFGMIGVDFESPQLTRLPKSSYYKYQEKIKEFKEHNKCQPQQSRHSS
ncbi:glycoside hydrolase family 1 protein [Pseudomonas paraeruginosa]|uniref:glycoside hydrolase family 1 protein n=1 Tax=Pseudomonas aeruginosa TaxID=287 RepID=UPI0021F841BA|nr:family 1 glycosylhydrolase [Pseudomonas aeruginosa]